MFYRVRFYRVTVAIPALHDSASARGLLPMTAWALAMVLAAGCSDRPASAETPPGVLAVHTGANHQGAHANVHEATTVGEGGHSSHAPSGDSSPTLPTTPWASDPHVREGMRRVHRAVEALGHAEHDHLDAGQATAAAQQVEDAATYMIANCKLPPEPDAALHGVLATLMTGAAAIKRDPADTTPLAAMRDAVALYPRLFVDATWLADSTPAE